MFTDYGISRSSSWNSMLDLRKNNSDLLYKKLLENIFNKDVSIFGNFKKRHPLLYRLKL